MSTFADFYSPPDGNPKSTLFLTSVKKIISYDYNSRFAEPGEFTMVIPLSNELLRLIAKDVIIDYDGDSLIIEDYSYDAGSGILTVKGTDLKGLTRRRVCVPYYDDSSDTYGYDVIEGNTKQCVQHYVSRNLDTPEDTERALPVIFNADSITGINDHYMAKGEYLSETIAKLLNNAGLGYVMNLLPSGYIEFKLLAGVDRSMGQTSIPRVVFCDTWKNTEIEHFEHASSNLINAVYASGAGIVSVVYPTETAPESFSRRETYIEVGADTVSEIPILALEAIKDNIESHSFSVTPISEGYGSLYKMGDYVSVRDPHIGTIYNGQITGITKSYTADGKKLSLTIGKEKPKFLNRIINNVLNGTQQRR